jgi:hypothetical protein
MAESAYGVADEKAIRAVSEGWIGGSDGPGFGARPYPMASPARMLRTAIRGRTGGTGRPLPSDLGVSGAVGGRSMSSKGSSI